MSGISSVEDFGLVDCDELKLSLKLDLKQLDAMKSFISALGKLESQLLEKRDEKNLAYNTGTQQKFARSQEEEVVWT